MGIWREGYFPAVGAAVIIIALLIIVLPRLTSRHDGGTDATNQSGDSGEQGRNTTDKAATGNGTQSTTTPTGETQPEIPTGYAVTGIVIDDQDNPIPDAEVTVHSAGHQVGGTYTVLKTARSGKDGRFVAENIPREDLFVIAEKEGYAFYVRGYNPGQRYSRYLFVQFSEGASKKDIRLIMHPGSVIAGKVIDESGDPIADVNVGFSIGSGYSFPWWRKVVTTDKDGAFACDMLSPGAYSLSAYKEGYVHSGRNGAETGQRDVLLALRKLSAIRGKVIFGDTKKPAVDALVNGMARTDEDGRFSLPINPDMPAMLLATWNGMSSEHGLMIDPRVDDIDNVVIELVNMASLSGKILDADTGKLVPGIHLRVGSTTRNSEGSVHPDGTFEFRDLSPGDTRIYVSSQEYVDAAKDPNTGGVPSVHLEPGEHRKDYIVRVRRKPELSISGAVVDVANEPIQGVRVVAISGGSRVFADTPVFTGPEGRFEIRMATEKEATGVFLSHPDYSPKYHKFEKLGENLVTNGLLIVMSKGGSISGTVTDSLGHPHAGASVELEYDWREGLDIGMNPLDATETDEAGRYTLPHVGIGAYRINARVDKANKMSAPVRMVRDEMITGVDLVIDITGTISGRVTDPEGSPVKDLDVSVTEYPTNEPSQTRVTSLDGRYSFEGLQEGKAYYLIVSRQIEGLKVTLAKTAKPVQASAENVDFEVELKEMGSLLVRVLWANDKAPVTEYDLRVSSDQFTPHGAYMVSIKSSNGEHTYDELWPGKYNILVKVPGNGPVTTAKALVEENKANEADVLVERASVIKGRVVSADTAKPVTDFFVTMRPVRKGAYNALYGKHYQSDEGAFEAVLSPDEYTLEVEAADYSPSEKMTVTLRAGAEESVRVEMPEGVALKGKVVDEDGNGISNATVGVGGVFFHAPTPQSITDASGSFRIENLPRLSYYSLSATHPDYADSSVPYEEQMNKQMWNEEITIVMRKAGTVYGTFTDIDGKVKSGISLALHSSKYSKSSMTDGKGGFRFEKVRPGEYYFIMDYRKSIIPRFELKSGEEKEVNIDLTEGGSLRGKVDLPEHPENAKISVQIWGINTSGSSYAPLNDEGEYIFESLPPDEYRVRVTGYFIDDEEKHVGLTTKTDEAEIRVSVSKGKETVRNIKITEVK